MSGADAKSTEELPPNVVEDLRWRRKLADVGAMLEGFRHADRIRFEREMAAQLARSADEHEAAAREVIALTRRVEELEALLNPPRPGLVEP